MSVPPWRSVGIVSAAMGTVFMAHSLLLLAVPLIGLRYGLSPAAIGLVVATPAVMPLLVAIPLGKVVGRLDPRRALIMGAFAYSVGAALSLAFPSLPTLIATQVMTGLAHVTLVIAAQATIAGLDEGSRMETWFGWYTTCLSVGQLIGPLLGGLLLHHGDVRITFAVVTALPLVAITIAWHLQTNLNPRPPSLPRQGLGYREQLALLRTNAGMQMSLLVTTGVLFAVGAHTAILPLFLEAKGVPATGIGILVSLRALFSTVVRPATSPIVQAFRGRARTLLVALIVIAVATSMIGLTTSYLLIGVLTALVGIGVGISQPLSMVAVADYVPATSRGPALGMRLMGNRGAQITSPLLLGVIVEVSTFAAAFLTAGAILLVAALAVSRLTPRFERFKIPDPPSIR